MGKKSKRIWKQFKVLSLAVAVISMNLFVVAPMPTYALSGTINFFGTGGANTNLNQAFTDGQTINGINASDIAGIDIDMFGSPDKTTKTGLFEFDSSQNCIFLDDVGLYSYTYLVIESRDGTDFSLNSLFINNSAYDQEFVRVEGMRDGISIGIVDLTLSSDGSPTHVTQGSGLTPSIFQNIDKVVITPKSTSLNTDDVTVGIGAINISDPALPSPPALTADTTSNSVDNDLEITFVEDATYRGAITGITYNGNVLTASQYDITQNGKVVLKPSVSDNTYLRTPSTANVVITATGYSNATVSQTITAGVATSLEVTTQPVPGTASGDAFATQPVVKLKDQYGNYCTTGLSASSNVVATAKAGTGTWTIGGTTTKAASTGTATFTDLTCTLITAGNGAITFTVGGVTLDSSNFTIPLNSGKTLTADTTNNSVDNDLEITFADDATFRGAITGITYNGNTLTASQYDATQNGKIVLKPSVAGNTYLRTPSTANVVITATGYNASTVSQTITAGVVTSLEVTTQPVPGTASGDVFATQPVVKLKDQYGNDCTTGLSASSNVVATANSGTGSWTIGGTTTKAASTGTATFTDLACNLVTAGNGAITFIVGGVMVDSSNFTIPLNSGKTLTADTTNNSVDNDLEITFVEDATFRGAITGITYNGNTLTASQYDTTQNGKIVLKPSVAGNTYLRTPSTANVVIIATGYNSSTVSQTITAGVATSLEVTTQPVQGTASGDAFATQPVVKLKDQYGNDCTTGLSASSNVVATAKSGTGSWSIGGPTTKAASTGTATFTDLTCTLVTAGNGAITFTVGGVTLDSSNFTIPFKTGKTLTADTTSNSVDNDLEITFVEDATFRGAITSITYNGNALTASQYDTTQNGKIVLKPSVAGNTYLRTPSTANVVITATGYNSSTVSQTLTAGVATSLEVTTQPVPGTASGDAFATQPVVKLKDQYGNYCTTGLSASSNVVATAKSGTGSWSIGGPTTKAASTGTATFTDLTCTLVTAGNGAITFTVGGVTLDSSNFTIPFKTGKTLTADTTSNSVDNDLEITFVEDATFRGAITSITYNGNTLTASQYDTTQNGKIVLKPSVAGNTYLRTPSTANVVITATGYNSSTVSQTLTAGVATSLEVTTQPVPGTASGDAFATQPVVKLKDQYGNYCTTGLSASSNVVATAKAGTGSWSIGGTTTKAASTGTATFTDLTCTLITAGNGAITFTVGGVTVDSGNFTLPLNSGKTLTADMTDNSVDNDLEITFAEDATFRGAITGITYNGNALTASQYDTTQNGKIVLKPSVAGNTYLRTPSTANVVIIATGYNSSTVSQTLTAGVATSLEVMTQPVPGTASGDAFATQPVVKLKDQYGNYCTTGVSASSNVVATAKSGTGSWSIGGTTTKAASTGTATFTDLTCTLTTAGNGAVTFTVGGVTVDSSNFALPINPGKTLTADTTNNSVDSDLEITFVEDATFRGAITGITYNGNALTASQYDTTQNGKIVLKPSVAGNTYLRTPSTANVVIIASGYNPSTVSQTLTAGVVTSLEVTTQPIPGTASGDAFATQPLVKLKDQYGNDCTTGVSASSNVVATAKSGTGSWTLGGTTTQVASSGTAAFTDLTSTILTTGTGKITFTTGAINVDSDAFTIPESQATVTPMTFQFDKYVSSTNYKDVTLTVDYKGATLTAVKNGAVTLIHPTDYSTSGNTVILQKSYLEKLALGNHQITLDFNMGTDVILNVTVVDTKPLPQPVPSIPSTPTPAPAPTPTPPANADNTGANVLVNGKSESAGVITNSKQGEQSVLTITVDQKKIEDKLSLEGQNAVVTIPVKSSSDIISAVLNGQMVKNMEAKDVTLKIQTDLATYTLDAREINISDVASFFNKEVKLSDINVSIEVAKPTASMVKVVENAEKKGAFSIISEPVEFKVTCSHNNQSVEVDKFNAYVERLVPIPNGIDPNKITTGIVVEKDGSTRHVPTKVLKVGDLYFAQINSLTNSTYSVIWHPKAFKDVEKHWSKMTSNEMGSRMVVMGVNENEFEPDRSVTRAEFATMLIKALGLKPSNEPMTFKDVKTSDWYYQNISTATTYKLINGYSAEQFGPNQTITREEAMVMIQRATQIAGMDQTLIASDLQELLNRYTDGGTLSNWAKNAASLNMKFGIVEGHNQKIRPSDTLSRAEAATLMFKLLKKAGLI